MDGDSKTSEGSELIPEPEPDLAELQGDLVADGVRIRDFDDGAKIYSLSGVGLIVGVSNYGATIVSALVPDRDGKFEDVLLGFDNPSDYKANKKYHIGGVVGRFANRLTWARFRIDSTIYEVTANSEDGAHHENGGFNGFDEVIWNACVPPSGHSVIFSHVSPDGHEGFPGSVLVQVQYTVIVDRLIVEMKAITTLPTPISLKQGLLINLAGHDKGEESLLEHVIFINADKYLITTHNMNPTGVLRNVRGTKMDFRTPTQLSYTFYETNRVGFDNSFSVNAMPPDSILYIGRIEHPPTGRVLEIHSDQPTVHFYTGRYLPHRPEIQPCVFKKVTPNIVKDEHEEGKNETGRGESSQSEKRNSHTKSHKKKKKVKNVGLHGKNEAFYFQNGGMWLAPQWFPNAPNVEKFENCILMPGDTYKYYTIYHFFTIKKTKKQLEQEMRHAEAVATVEEILERITESAIDAVDNAPSELEGSQLKVI